MVSTTFSQLAALAAIVAALASPTATALPRIDPGVHRTLRRQATVNLIVTLHQDTAAPLAAVQESNFDSRGAKIEALVQKLQAHATTTQADISKMLLQESSDASPLFTKAESLWITNELFFENATIELAEKLANMPSVASIREEDRLRLTADTPTEVTANTNATTAASVEWGVSIIKAPEVWATGNTGQGIVVGGIDTGVRSTHEVLRANFRSSYGWFDATAGKLTPYDDDGHGSHTLGTVLGANGLGVAPGAKWIGCRACTKDFCMESWIKACLQFMLCPTDAAGKNPDCSKAPNVVNNSWGGSGGDNRYESVLKAWTAAGIIPVFSAGNSGSGNGCSTMDSPADSALAIAVGATSITDGLGVFSSKGPTKSGLIKPDLSAPGVNVRSANFPADNAYKAIDGTSHAAPHVAGVVALMLSANNKLSVSQVRSILTSTTDQTLQPSGSTCGNTKDTTFPNNQYGYGRVNALKAVRKAATTTN